MATPEQLELAQAEVATLISVALKQGLNSWELLDIFLRACVNLHLMASGEYRVRQNQA